MYQIIIQDILLHVLDEVVLPALQNTLKAILSFLLRCADDWGRNKSSEKISCRVTIGHWAFDTIRSSGRDLSWSKNNTALRYVGNDLALLQSVATKNGAAFEELWNIFWTPW